MKTSPFKILIVFFIISFLGLFAVPYLSVSLTPRTNSASLSIAFSWPNASSRTVEQHITSKLESGLSTIREIRNIVSRSTKGGGIITLNFNKSVNIDVKRFEVLSVIRQLRTELPTDAGYPTIIDNPQSDGESSNTITYNVKSTASSSVIYDVVETVIIPGISSISGVDKVELFGLEPMEYVVYFDAGKMQTLGLDRNLVVKKIKEHYSQETLGETQYNEKQITIQLNGLRNSEWHIPIKKVGEKIIYLDEISTVALQEKRAHSYYRLDGENAVSLSVSLKKEANIFQTLRDLENSLNEVKTMLPLNYQIINTYDSTSILSEELETIFKRSFATILILFIFTLAVHRSFRYLLIITLSVSFNISIAFLIYYLLGIPIHLYSLAGITISLGLIMDNSIIMIYSITKNKSKAIFRPLLASTVSTAGSMSVIFLIDDTTKINLTDFASVIIINLSLSLVIALLVVPALTQLIKIPPKKISKTTRKVKKQLTVLYFCVVSLLLRYKKAAFALLVLIFGIPVFLLPKKIDNESTKLGLLYNKTLGSKYYLENIRPNLDIALGGISRLFYYHVSDKTYYTAGSQTKLLIEASAERGYPIEQMNHVTKEIEAYLKRLHAIEHFKTNIYEGEYALIEIIFKDDCPKAFPLLLKSRAIALVQKYGGLQWNIRGIGKGYDVGVNDSQQINFTVKAKGYNYDQLSFLCNNLRDTLSKHPRITQISVTNDFNNKSKIAENYTFNLNHDRIVLNNRVLSDIIEGLNTATISSDSDLNINIDGKSSSVRLESDSASENDFFIIKNMPFLISNTAVEYQPLKNLIEMESEIQEEGIGRENQEYVRYLHFQYTGTYRNGSTFLDNALEDYNAGLPLGYTFHKKNRTNMLTSETENSTAWLLGVIAIFIYIVCAVLFENLRLPFNILIIAPISFIGIFLVFYLFDYSFDQGGLASIVLLCGTTVTSTIYIANEYNILKNGHRIINPIFIYIVTFKKMIIPILLSLLSTLLGFVPFILKGQKETFWFSLGMGAISGLLFTVIGIFFYLPLTVLRDNSLKKLNNSGIK